MFVKVSLCSFTKFQSQKDGSFCALPTAACKPRKWRPISGCHGQAEESKRCLVFLQTDPRPIQKVDDL